MISSTQTNQPFAPTAEPPQDVEQFVTDSVSALRKAGCRITRTRTKLLRILAERNKPTTVEELHAAIGHEECDLVTIYRSMAAFEELGLVSHNYLHSGTALYERRHEVEHPYRVVCKVSNRVTQIDPALATPLRQAIQQVEDILRAQGYGQVSHVLEFFVVDPEIAAGLRSRAPAWPAERSN